MSGCLRRMAMYTPGTVAPDDVQSWRMGSTSEEHPGSSMGSSSKDAHA